MSYGGCRGGGGGVVWGGMGDGLYGLGLSLGDGFQGPFLHLCFWVFRGFGVLLVLGLEFVVVVVVVVCF